MVYAKISELERYLMPDIYEKIKIFLEQVCESMSEGEYPIWGDKIYARVMSYYTGSPEECQIEAHDKYIDIQAAITGAEGISVYERTSLSESESYNSEKDVVFFDKECAMVHAHTVNVPGYFTMLYPEDAHRPQEKVCDIDRVKKFVIKVRV